MEYILLPYQKIKEKAQMEKQTSWKKIIIEMILFPLLVVFMAYLIFKGCDFKSMNRTIAGSDPVFLIIAVVCICFFVVCESINITRVLKAMGYDIKKRDMIKYGAAGFFFSGITPSASGGQPMQLYYMSRDGINISHGSLSLLIELAGWQLVNIVLALFGLFYNFKFLMSTSAVIKLILGIGLLADTVILVIILAIIFDQNAATRVEKIAAWSMRKFHKGKYMLKIRDQIREYKSGAVYIRENPKLIMKNLLTAFAQLISMYSITYFVYLALGCSGHGWVEIFSLQAVLSAGIAVIPIPGTVGANEGVFKRLFAPIFGAGLVMPAMLLSRGISFYLCLAATGVYLLVAFFIDRAAEASKRKASAISN